MVPRSSGHPPAPRTFAAARRLGLPASRVLTLHLTVGGTLVGESPADEDLVRSLLPAREGDRVDGSGPGPARSHLEILVTRAALRGVAVVVRSDLPPVG